jgi:hypothetical protein
VLCLFFDRLGFYPRSWLLFRIFGSRGLRPFKVLGEWNALYLGEAHGFSLLEIFVPAEDFILGGIPLCEKLAQCVKDLPPK